MKDNLERRTEALEMLSKELEGKTIFYPGCGGDFSAERALEKSTVIYNDKDLRNFKNFRQGDCFEVFKEIDYDVLYLCDMHFEENKETADLLNKAKEMLILFHEEHGGLRNILNENWELKGVFKEVDNKIVLDTETLGDYCTFDDEKLRKNDFYKCWFSSKLNEFENYKGWNKKIFENIVNTLSKSNEGNFLKNYETLMIKLLDKKSKLLILNALITSTKQEFLEAVNYINKIRTMNEDELKNEADKKTLLRMKAEKMFNKEGFLYIYRRK